MIDTKSTDFLLNLYERFGDKAQEALNFVMRNQGRKDDEIPAANLPLSNGVYLIYMDGSYIEYTEQPAFTDYTSIGIAHDGHYFRVPHNWNLGSNALLKDERNPKDNHCLREADAMMNWDFVGETQYLKQLGLAFDLKEGYYLPTMPVFLAMYANREVLNKGLRMMGAEEINFKEDYWIAQRYGVDIAWIFNGNGSNLVHGGISYAFQVGAIALWEPEI